VAFGFSETRWRLWRRHGVVQQGVEADADNDYGCEPMTSRRISVFFDGLFMDEELLRAKGVQPTSPRPASVPGFAIRVGQRATLVPRSNERAHGFLMELSHVEIDRL
jgi:hypothetical protein